MDVKAMGSASRTMARGQLLATLPQVRETQDKSNQLTEEKQLHSRERIRATGTGQLEDTHGCWLNRESRQGVTRPNDAKHTRIPRYLKPSVKKTRM